MEEKSAGWHQTPVEREAKGREHYVGVGAGDEVCGLSSREGPRAELPHDHAGDHSLGPYHGPGTVQGISPLNLTASPEPVYYYPPFTDKKTEAP